MEALLPWIIFFFSLYARTASRVVHPQVRNAVADLDFLWPDGIVYYTISSELVDLEDKIQIAMMNIEDSVNDGTNFCVRFIPRNSEPNYVEIFQGDGCYSSVGMENSGRQTLSLGPGCEFTGTIIHELLHTLGFYHEHNRYDRDSFVDIDLTNVVDGGEVNFDLMDAGTLDLLDTDYDFDSVMNYDPYTLAHDPAYPVLVPFSDVGSSGVFQMGQRLALSQADVLRIQRLYTCTEDTAHIVRPEIDNEVLACNFHTDLCGMENGGGDLDWVTVSGESLAGPFAGHSFGTDPYLVAKAEGNLGSTAMVSTPVSSAGGVCIDFYVFLTDATSSLSLEAFGPDFLTTALPFTASSSGYGQWTRYQSRMDIPEGYDFQITFKAVIGYSDVALDDIRVYAADCN